MHHFTGSDRTDIHFVYSAAWGNVKMAHDNYADLHKKCPPLWLRGGSYVAPRSRRWSEQFVCPSELCYVLTYTCNNPRGISTNVSVKLDTFIAP